MRGSERLTGTDGPVEIPADDENPARDIIVFPFYIDKTTATNEYG
jgi:hypothetical protein